MFASIMPRCDCILPAMKKLRWGILGTGNIANQFAADVMHARRGTLAAVGSRSADSAAAFAQRYNIPTAHGSYDALLADPDIDAIYLTLPNSMHHAWTLRALEAGKHVLCEKPIAANAVQAAEMFDASRRHGRVLMEAFMYKSHPLIHKVIETLPSIGRVKLVRTSFCFCVSNVHANTRFSTELAGGALMDIGCYCTSFSRMIAGGEPIDVHCRGHLHESGVDDYAAGVLAFANGVLATFTCALTVQADNTVSICGEEGYIEIPVPWKPPAARSVFTVGYSQRPKMDGAGKGDRPEPRTFEVSCDRPLYALEADDFAAAVLDGAPLPVTEADTMGNMRVLDELRRQVGVAF